MLIQIIFMLVFIQNPGNEEMVNFNLDTFFELSPEMIEFIDERVMVQSTDYGKLNFLLNAIFDESILDMTYSNTRTTTPIETFALRTGNCLSFTAMFIAMARYCGIEAQFQEVYDLSSWTKKGEFTVYNRHMNCTVFIDGIRKEVDFNYLNKKEFILVRPATDRRGIAHFYNNLGAEELSKGNFYRAKIYIEKALEVDPSFSFGWTNLGVVHRLNNEFVQAEACYIKAANLNSRDHTPSLNLALLYESQGKDNQAKVLFKKVKRFVERNPYHHYELGKEAFEKGQYDVAVGHLKRAVKIHKTHPIFLLSLAAAYQKSGNLKKASKLMEKAKKQAANFDEKVLYDRKLQLIEGQK